MVEFLHALLQASQNVFLDPVNIFWICSGTFLGIVIGAIPGLGPALGVAIIIPFTMHMETVPALLFAISIYDGAMYGGSIASILLNTPGDASAAATTLEGFPMSKKGKAIDALMICGVSSSLGGVIGDIIVILFCTVLGSFILLFGTPEYALLGILGVIIVSRVSKGAFYKGIIAGLLGLGVTTIGIGTMSADVRFAFGIWELYEGLPFITVLMGMFGVATMSQLAGEPQRTIATGKITGSRLNGIITALKEWPLIIKSSLIGLFIGAFPGAGGSLANFVAYGEAVRSNPKEKFGEGNPKGLVATESSNNAMIDGALLPTLLFGIPGSGTTAAFLAIMILHGFRWGHSLFTGEGLVILLTIFMALLFSEIIIIVFAFFTARYIGYITTIDKNLIIPFVIIVAALGVFTMRFSFADLAALGIFGFLGFIMNRYGYPIVPAVIGAILGGIIEENFLRSLTLGNGPLIFINPFTNPVSLILVLLIVFILFQPFFSAAKGRLFNKSKSS
ncbi:MAG: tripartite tricarboxylate transporter permease [Desulfobacteraceae bacterium]|nr:tripartite tricarboxylate transporter permease [Desulfobacteraceae bacterium]